MNHIQQYEEIYILLALVLTALLFTMFNRIVSYFLSINSPYIVKDMQVIEYNVKHTKDYSALVLRKRLIKSAKLANKSIAETLLTVRDFDTSEVVTKLKTSDVNGKPIAAKIEIIRISEPPYIIAEIFL